MNNVDNLRAHNLKLDACTKINFEQKRSLTHTYTHRFIELLGSRKRCSEKMSKFIYIVRPSIICGVCVYFCDFRAVPLGSIWTRIEPHYTCEHIQWKQTRSIRTNNQKRAFEKERNSNAHFLSAADKDDTHTNSGREKTTTTFKVFSCHTRGIWWRRHLTKDNMCALQILLLKWTK